MNCTNCNSAWESNVDIANCPFCNCDITEIYHMHMVSIIEKGTDIMYECPQNLSASIDQYYGDTKMGRLLNLLVTYDVPKQILKLQKLDNEKFLENYYRILEKTSIMSFIDKEVLAPAMEVFCLGLGIHVKKPENNTNENSNKEIDGKKVKIEFDMILSEYTGSGELTIPDGVTHINENIFNNCDRLTDLTIPGSLKNIKENEFAGCQNLKSIVIKPGTIVIGSNSFKDCTSLTSITIPNTTQTISANAFQNCSSLTNVVIPNSMQTIGENVFENCSSLTHLIIPNSVENIGENSFKGCSNLTKIILPSTLTEIMENTFNSCQNLSELNIPNSVVFIGDGAFVNCPNLPESLIHKITEINPKALSETEV